MRDHRTLSSSVNARTRGGIAAWGIPSQERRTRAVSSPSVPRLALGRSPRQPPRPTFLAALLGLLCLNGAGALELATHAVVAPRHALHAEAMCAAAHHAALGIEAALIALDGLPLEDLKRTAVLRDAAEVSLEALEAEWQRTIAWIDGARKQLASANARAVELTSLHVGATGASVRHACFRAPSTRAFAHRACCCSIETVLKRAHSSTAQLRNRALVCSRKGDGEPSVARPFNDASDASRTQQIEPPASIEHAPPARRRSDDYQAFAVQCWAARSAFTDQACNCLGEAAHPKLNSRPTIRIVVGSWYISWGCFWLPGVLRVIGPERA
jgi:hypothetical protein